MLTYKTCSNEQITRLYFWLLLFWDTRVQFNVAFSPGAKAIFQNDYCINKRLRTPLYAKAKKTKAANSGGFGAAIRSTSSTKTTFDASAALLRSEKKFEELGALASKTLTSRTDNYDDDETFQEQDVIHSEFVIAARCTPEGKRQSGAAALSDWVPVAQLAMMRSTSDSKAKEHVHTSVSYYCREIFHAAQSAAPIFKSFPRNSIQYSAEPLDSFFKFVYDDIIEHAKEKAHDKGSDTVMTRKHARNVLELPADSKDDLSEIKLSYRKLSMQYHPDRLIGQDMTPEEKEEFSKKFTQIKVAYETLCSGIRDSSDASSLSWYESLGGRERNEFFMIEQLYPLEEAKAAMEQNAKTCKFQSAVAGLDPDTVMAFVARNQAASRQ